MTSRIPKVRKGHLAAIPVVLCIGATLLLDPLRVFGKAPAASMANGMQIARTKMNNNSKVAKSAVGPPGQASVARSAAASVVAKAADAPPKVKHINNSTGCDKNWGVFGDGPLTRTSWNWAPPERIPYTSQYNDHQNTRQGLYLSPRDKFAYCVIEKNGCSQMTTVLSRTELRWGAAGQWWDITMLSQQRHGKDGLNKLFDDDKAIRAVWVREPLDRFVSAILSKCSSRGFCPMFKPGMTFHDALLGLRHLNSRKIEGSFMAQAYHCQLERRVNTFTVIGVVSPNMTTDLQCMLYKAGIQQWQNQPHAAPGKHGNYSQNEILQRLYTPEAIQLVQKFYQVDYQTFHFPDRPAWTENLSSEWYNMPIDQVKKLLRWDKESHT